MKIRMLAPLDIDCLRWVAYGRSLSEIASIEGISVSDARTHIERAVAARQAKSTEEAIARLKSDTD